MIKNKNNKVKHEVWEDAEGLTTLCLADERGDDYWKLMKVHFRRKNGENKKMNEFEY